MSSYVAPTRDMLFVIEHLADRAGLSELPGGEELSKDLVEAILSEAAKLAQDVLDPLNRSGDKNGATLSDDGVKPAEGFAAAYQQFVDGGWNALPGPEEFGGQGLPKLMASTVGEMLQSANMSFSLCPMLTASAIEALEIHGSEQQKAIYLEKLVSGEWTGTMNLTEPQAGSDLGAVAMKAEPNGDHFKLYGQKIFITWGDHDMTDNILHLVLARTPDAPAGVKGISLFLVPKYIVANDGSLGRRNDVHCVSLEHKLGIHASPTAVLAYGDNDGAVGYLIGEENKGLVYMFTMMNDARLNVGIQGMAIAERAYQRARAFAKERVQGQVPGKSSDGRVAIIHHPDVRRMLMTMKAHIEAMRALCYVSAAAMDVARRHPDQAVRASTQGRVDLLIPIVKGWCTESGIDLASLALQVHGGMGYIEETGAAQHFRDARISSIYEGTTGIQANDLVGRKLRMDQGAAMRALIVDMRRTLDELRREKNPQLERIAVPLEKAIAKLEATTNYMLETISGDMAAALGGAVDYLLQAGFVCGAWQMARAALKASQKTGAGESDSFFAAKIVSAVYYAEHVLPHADALAEMVQAGTDNLFTIPIEQL